MECSLEDLFAEPPPKVADDAVNATQSKDVPFDLGYSKEVHLNVTAKYPNGLKDLENNCTTLSSPAKSICNIEERRNPEVSEKNKVDIRKRYHVPTIEDILGSSMVHEIQRKRNSFEEDIEGIRLKGHQNVKVDIKLSSETQDPSEGKCISDAFKEKFRQKNTKLISEKPAVCTNATLKRKSDAHAIDGINSEFETKGGIDGNVNRETTHTVSKRRKAGNYQRKLHTKCRISAKEIWKLANDQNDDYQEFFADIGRSMDVERSTITKGSVENCQNIYPKNNSMNVPLGLKKKSGKKKSKKKWKNKKRKDKISKLKESIVQENDDVNDYDDIIMPTQKDLKPHKWPVCKQTSRIESAKNGNGSGTISERGEGKSGIELDENYGNRKLAKEGRDVVENVVLDSILEKLPYLRGVMKEGTENNNKTQGFTLSYNDILEYCETKNSIDASNISFDLMLECVKAFNENRPFITKSNPGGNIQGTFIDAQKNYMFKKRSEKNCPNNISSGPEVAMAQWYDDTGSIICQPGVVEVKSDSDVASSGKNEVTTSCKREIVDDNSVGNHGNENNDRGYDIDKNDCNDINIHTDNSLRLDIEQKSNTDKDAPCISPFNGLHKETMHVKEKGIAQKQNIQRMPFKLSDERSHGESLLSNVCGLPADLAIVGKEKEQLHSGKRKRGGRKKKEKRKSRCNALQTRIKAEEKTVAECKFFLKGKCNKGADCRFLHKGTPQRRELCRYYVTDSCLADDCIFMHNDFPCKFFHGNSKCANGNNCKYSHEPLTEETKKLLEELFARDDAVKKEGTALPTEQNNGVPAEKLTHDKEADEACPRLYSSLI